MIQILLVALLVLTACAPKSIKTTGLDERGCRYDGCNTCCELPEGSGRMSCTAVYCGPEQE